MLILLNMFKDCTFLSWLCEGMRTYNKPLHMSGFIGWKAAGFPSTPHSTQFKISTPLTLYSLHNCNTGSLGKMNTKGKLKESKVFTCWIRLLLWTRLRAWGCHWYKVWTFLRTRPGHGKAPGGTVSEKILLQHCDWSVDLKLWWKRAERLFLAIAGWNAIYACHSESALPFSTQPFQPCPKPHCCNVTKIHQEVSLICVHLSVISNVPTISQ